ncbi:MAG TPA: DEAD/DEAH box helicase family protein [Phycisphaerae bacterium]|nr:DEAD/DEAH box helicase family protein [Phycisphaerae bacterium]
MPEQFLYETLNAVSGMGFLKKEIPESVALNLNPKYEVRPYQIEAFARFFHCQKSDFPGKAYPLYFLFNMATGSGKTLIMAGLILYLYEQGYRNFLFFVNSTNIIQKTKDNFLNPLSSKFLFKPDIFIGNRHVRVSPVENFEGVNPNDINICFTTIQQLHIDLTTEKENAITFEDFRKHKVVLIADEAHHLNTKTRRQLELFESWENTVESIFKQNVDNLLLEFTATHDYEDPNMVSKYRNKVIIRYDLQQYRNERFSKDVMIVQSDFDLEERILQALILSQYKQEVAAKHRINLKPVVLLKAQRTIAQSHENKASFHKLIASLKAKQIAQVRKSDIPVIQRAFQFFAENKITDGQLVERLKREFHEDFCLSVNVEGEKEQYQLLLNSLEDRNNRIRAIFAVQKLNEGWDVLNLFDIVRCYEHRDTGRQKIGKTTTSEAQLIGRGARYFPFVLPESNDRFRRKFDGDMGHELRVLEELHYHSINDFRYIYEIRAALVAQGIMDEDTVEKRLTLKDAFQKTPFYKYGVIYTNDRLENDYQQVKSLADMGVKKRNYVHVIATGHGGASAILADRRQEAVVSEESRKDVNVTDIERNIVESAVARNPFFSFASLHRYFPHLTSMREFITSESFLGGLAITFQGDVHRLDENKAETLRGMVGLLHQIETEARQQITDYRGSREFRHGWVHDIFHDKILKFGKGNPLALPDPQFEAFIAGKDWYVFNALYGTSEEKPFVRMLERQMPALKKKYEAVYLVRNEGHFKIYNFSDGQAFEPDFVLFLREKTGSLLTYQLFIEPKGKHITEHDQWKATFLKEICEEFADKILTFAGDSKYRLIGLPFYNIADENEFKDTLQTTLNV